MNKWLIIDDDSEDQEIFEIALSEVDAGITLLKAFNGADAMEQLKAMSPARLPALIFMDLNMGEMDGRECLAELKKNEELKNIPVLIYSTSADQRDVNDLMALGAARFITKPNSMPELVAILREALALQSPI